MRAGPLPKASTFIVKGDLKIEGDIDKNSLIIAQGKVQFNLTQPSDWRNSCPTQTIRGIVLAQKGFVASSNNGFKNTNLSQAWCRQGNLKVYGALIGNNLATVVNSRRSHLENWFTQADNNRLLQ